MKIKKNDLIELEISALNNLGFGVARLDGFVVFVDGAVTGELVLARIIKMTASYAVARTEKIITPSEHRTSERCQSRGCKSCAYRAITYSEEKRQKRENVIADFKKAGLSSIEVLPVLSADITKGYRNKAQYPIALGKDGEYIIGFFAPKSHRVTEAADCPLAPRVFSEIIELLRAFFSRHGISVYDEEPGEGLLRHIYLRRGEVSGEILLTLVINGSVLPHSDELIEKIRTAFPAVVGILLNENTEKTNVILGKKFITLWGRDYIYDTLADVRLKITAPSFYQVNHSGAELLYALARELASPRSGDTVLDLYCGAGSIGLSMANDAGYIVGVEIIESAVECARENAEANGIENAAFFVGDAADTEGLLKNARMPNGDAVSPDIVILDPPRGGCDGQLIKYVASLSPERIVYISCNPATQARDCALFATLGYTADKVVPVDMFPGTGHVESVVCLTQIGRAHV